MSCEQAGNDGERCALITIDIRPHPDDARNGKEAQRRVDKDIAKRLRPAKRRTSPPASTDTAGPVVAAELMDDEYDYSGEEYGGDSGGDDVDPRYLQQQFMYAASLSRFTLHCVGSSMPFLFGSGMTAGALSCFHRYDPDDVDDGDENMLGELEFGDREFGPDEDFYLESSVPSRSISRPIRYDIRRACLLDEAYWHIVIFGV